MIKGFATLEGTERLKNRFQGKYSDDFFRLKKDLWFSSIGIGSYLGEPDAKTDAQYEDSFCKAVSSGINVIDTAINYRAQRSERAFGKAIAHLVGEGKAQRDELIICTKAGFIPFDGGWPDDPNAFIQQSYIQSGILCEEDIAQGCHAMTSKYLENQLSRSLANLGLETIDLLYLHNPETQLGEVDRGEFLNRVREAFKWCEEKVKEGKIRFYGVATWTGFRAKPDAADYLSLEELNVIAREAGGGGHHFKAAQLPINLAMPEAWIFPNQSYGANLVPFLGIAPRYDMVIVASASLLQARLAGPLPTSLDPYFKDLKQSAQRAIQFTRSLPGLTTALVGMKSSAHVIENMEIAKYPAIVTSELIRMFSK